MTMPKNPLTSDEVEAARRLRRIWDSKRRELGLTQEKVAHLCEWSTQGAFGHYLNKKNALNVEAVIKLSCALQVSPDDIWPGLVPVPPAPAGVVSDDALRLALAIESLRPEDRAALRAVVDAFLESKGVSLYGCTS